MTILDNRTPKAVLGDYLRTQLADDAEVLRIVSAYFTVYAYEALRTELENAKTVQFLYGDPGSVGEIDPGEKASKDFGLIEGSLSPGETLQQKRLAKDCEQWITEKVEVRTVKQTNFLHGKMYHFERSDNSNTAVLGSSNFTRRGLGFDSGANIELNLPVADATVCDELKQWFDGIWRDNTLTKDAKQEVLNALRRLGENCSPELVYFKTLLEVFRDRMDAREETDNRLGTANLKDTQIWKALYQFQRDGVVGIINRLRQYGGCILADSVGLGKTYTALAVIRYFQEKNHRILVLCPKKLNENWRLYPAHLNQYGNPFRGDNFNYTVLHHTDLSRYAGESNGVNLENLDWGSFGLVVIDESHNFRNESSSVRDEHGNIIRRSRYERLLRDIIQNGGETKVLMLSATPVNTSLTDLRNQIYFMTGKREDAFHETLGIRSVGAMLGVAQKRFKEWEQQSDTRDKRDLFNVLGGDFFALLDAVSIARSRRHVKKFYPDVIEKIGGFPIQSKPENQAPATDANGEFSYETLNAEIQKFKLAIYAPTAYIVSEQGLQALDAEKAQLNFNQVDREKWLIGMIRVNFLKRLESAAPSLMLTLQRTIDKIDQQLEKIKKYEAREASDTEVTVMPDEDMEDDDFVVNKARHPVHLDDLNVRQWRDDLHEDRAVLESARVRVAAITPERDSKLAALEARLLDKLKTPSTDKDGRKNRKVLVFTAFKDTAIYLYQQLLPVIEAHDATCAMVAGDETRTTVGRNEFNEILTNFAPRGRGRSKQDAPQIDILIATDCVSEGQNLQDCDLVVNYDIHWNPVRLIQRFGRIDRLGSRNAHVGMVNFWPTQELDHYLNLQSRVEARMALMDATATGDERLAPGGDALDETEKYEDAQLDLDFRSAQLRRLRDEVPDMDDLNDGVTLSDFSLDDFLAQLMNYLQQNRQELERTPLGVYAVADCAQGEQSDLFPSAAAPGVIFCLRQKNAPQDKRLRSPLTPYYLIYVRDDGEVRYNYIHAKQTLELFGELARGQNEPLLPLCDAFDCETENGRNMEKYDGLLEKVFLAIGKQFDRGEAGELHHRDGVIAKNSEHPRNANDFELITWLVIKDSKADASEK